MAARATVGNATLVGRFLAAASAMAVATGAGRPTVTASSERGFIERATDEVSSWLGDREAERRREQDYRGRGPKGYKRSDSGSRRT